jgi:hypothetical protein
MSLLLVGKYSYLRRSKRSQFTLLQSQPSLDLLWRMSSLGLLGLEMDPFAA